MTRSTAKDLALIRRAFARPILAEANIRSAPLETFPRPLWTGVGGGVRARQRARKSCARSPKIIGTWTQARVIHGDASAAPFDPADGSTVNVGAARPPAAWLDTLGPGGRMPRCGAPSGRAGGSVRRLHRRSDVPAERCWLRGKAWRLA